MNARSAERPDGRRSWLVAIVGSVAMVFTFGTPLSYGVFHQPLSDAFGISAVALSGIFSIMLCTFFIGSGLVGIFAARVPARLVLLLCAVATGLIAPALYVVSSYLELAVVFAVMGLALGTVFVLTASIIPRWFDRRRGAATGLLFVGNGLGLFVLPPIWQQAIGTRGVRSGFLLIMSASAVAFLVASVLCRRPVWAEQTTSTSSELLAWLSRLLATRSFQLLFVGMALAFAWYQLLAAYAIDFFGSRGLPEAAASTMFGLIGGVSIISRIGGGYVADLVGARRAFLASLCCAGVGIALLFAPSLAVLVAAVFLIGIGLGGTATLYIPLLMQAYDPKRDTAIVGVFNIAGGVGALLMPPLGVASVAYTGGYTVVIGLTVGVTVIAFVAVVAGTRSL